MTLNLIAHVVMPLMIFTGRLQDNGTKATKTAGFL